MSTAHPKSLTIVAVLLILLAVFSISTTVISQSGLLRGTRPQNFQQGSGSFQGNNDNNNGNFHGGGNGNFRTGGGFNLFSITRTLGLAGPAMIYINLGFTLVGIALCLLSAYGVWKLKAWGLNLGMTVALLFLLGVVPGLFFGNSFRFTNPITIVRNVINALEALASLPILVMGILPSAREYLS